MKYVVWCRYNQSSFGYFYTYAEAARVAAKYEYMGAYVKKI